MEQVYLLFIHLGKFLWTITDIMLEMCFSLTGVHTFSKSIKKNHVNFSFKNERVLCMKGEESEDVRT